MDLVIYVLYALVQAILTIRYLCDESDRREPMFAFVVFLIFAPALSIYLLWQGLKWSVSWLVTHPISKEQPKE